MTKTRQSLLRLCISACLLALALVLPFATFNTPQVGKVLCLMHLPVLLCGFFCGPIYGGAVGAVAPILRSVLFSQPKIYPDAPGMCVELMLYGVTAGLLYMLLPKKKPSIYVSLIVAMLVGRLGWGITRAIFLGIWNTKFSWQIFFMSGFVNAMPGIILQIVFIPLLIMATENQFPYLTAYGGNKRRMKNARSKKSRSK